MIEKSYRSDIQVLRGLAVLLVVLYHAACPWFPAGFIGVDVFFVISGYLMAFALRDLSKEAILNYYARRARRIMPAYITAIFAVWVGAVLIALPFETQQYSEKMLYSVTGFPNLGFWIDNSYFAPQLFRPGLHFWSLGVELQFYLILPLIVWLHLKNRKFTAAFLILSLLASLVMTEISPKTAFFLTPFRIWEFLAGYLIAGLPAPKPRVLIAPLLLLALIIYACVQIPVKQFPGFYALPPVILSTALIYFGFENRIRMLNPVYKLLEKMGEYSYSIYLVHFPVFIFLFYQPFATQNTVEWWSVKTVMAFIITALLSISLYHGVEFPLRRKIIKRRKIACAAAAIIVLGMLCLATGPVLSSLKYPPQYAKIFAAFFDRDVYRCGKIKRLTEPFTASCTLASGMKKDHVTLLVGNSYADSIKPVLTEEARKADVPLRLMKANCALGVGECTVNQIVSEVRETNVSHVILHSSPGGMNPQHVIDLQKAGRENGFDVFLIEPTPDWAHSVPRMLYEAENTGAILPEQNYRDVIRKNKELHEGLEKLRTPSFRRYDAAQILCAPSCRMLNGEGYPLYFDSGHLTLRGSQQLRPLAKKLFSDVLESRSPETGR